MQMESRFRGLIPDPHQCGRPVMHFYFVGDQVPYGMACGHCGEVVYREVLDLKNHRFTCYSDGTARWYASDLDAEVHRCGQDVGHVDDAQLRVISEQAQRRGQATDQGPGAASMRGRRNSLVRHLTRSLA